MDPNTMVLLLSVVLPLLVSLAGALYKLLVSKLPQDQQDQVERAVGQVVSAVEQLYDGIPGSGAAKKQEAIKLAKSMLAALHLPANDALLNVLIESAVRQLPPTDQQAPDAAQGPMTLSAI